MTVELKLPCFRCGGPAVYRPGEKEWACYCIPCGHELTGTPGGPITNAMADAIVKERILRFEQRFPGVLEGWMRLMDEASVEEHEAWLAAQKAGSA